MSDQTATGCIQINHGANNAFVITIFLADGVTPAPGLASVDDIVVTIRKYAEDDAGPVLTLRLTQGVTLLTQSGATLGQASVVVTAAQADEIAAGDWVGDVFVVESDSTPQLAFRLKIKVCAVSFVS